jgi:hypothetical protein
MLTKAGTIKTAVVGRNVTLTARKAVIVAA